MEEEGKEDNAKALEKEPELLQLIKSVREQIEYDGQKNVKYVDEKYSNNMGYFAFTRHNKPIISNVVLIHVINEDEREGENRIYMRNGDGSVSEIAREVYDLESPSNKKMKVNPQVELDKEVLSQQIEKSKQLQREREDELAGTAIDEKQRILPQEQRTQMREAEQAKENGEKEEQQLQDDQPKEKLENLKDKIEIRDRQQIRLDTLINGFYLYELLQLQEKLKGRLPDGVSERGFKDGYLTFVKSEELTARDGKERKQEHTFVVRNFSGDMVELDEDILETANDGGLQDRKDIEDKTHYTNREGVEAGKPETETDLLTTTSYRIAGAHQVTGSSWDSYLEIKKDEGFKREAETPEDRYTENIVFSQTSRLRNLEGEHLDPTQREKGKISTYLTGKDENQTPEERREGKDDLKQEVEGEKIYRNYFLESVIDESGIREHYNSKDVDEARKFVEELYKNGETDKDKLIQAVKGEYPYSGEKVLGDNANPRRGFVN